ncbi:MAG: PQQ-dependent sugar dehydrogenase, partial [Actinomycetota bacterium]|nr:PQQ-dependent sugar dehydrogenase [Actinomycetota bacterium]
MRRWMPALTLLLALTAAGCTGSEPSAGTGVPTPSGPHVGSSIPAVGPEVRVEVVASGLEHVWDIGFLPDGTALITERPGRIRLLSGTSSGAAVADVAADLEDVYVRGEGGLMGLLVH